MRVLTFGHGTADASELTRLLREAEARALVDVRTAPGSRRNPDATREAMSTWLPEAGITYRWDRRLGGWRKPPADPLDTALRNRSFTGYAAHMRSTEFRTAIDELVGEAAESTTTVILCAESVWWRCHRKMIADFLVLVRGIDVAHLMHDSSVRPHRPTPEARNEPGRDALIYDAGQTSTHL